MAFIVISLSEFFMEIAKMKTSWNLTILKFRMIGGFVTQIKTKIEEFQIFPHVS